MGKLPRSFYDRPTLEVARELLGKVLVRHDVEAVLKGRIVEAEGYCGQSDPGSHAYRGPTPRTQVMFEEAGHLYVYFTYGAHFCMNVVTEGHGVAGAVLVRALQPVEGISVMERRRGGRPLVELCNGPGKLCQALGITRSQNGVDLECDEVWIEDDGFTPPDIAISTRVGLNAGADFPYRFFVPGSPFVSRGKPSRPQTL